MKTKLFKNILIVFIFLSIILSVFAVSYLHLLDSYELVALDIRFLLRPKIFTTDKIVFIEIGQDTIDKLGRFPFDRSYHAILIKALSESGAKMIFFDFLFSEPQEHDNELEYALNQAGNVYLPYAFDIDKTKSRAKTLSIHGYVAKCLESLGREARGTGHINMVPDPDGKFRRIPIFIRYEDTFHPSISFIMGCDYLGIPLKDVKFVPGKYIVFGKGGVIPLDEDSYMIVNFSGRWGASYKHYSYIDILQSYFAKSSGQRPVTDLADLKDKICVVGLTATGTGDAHPNPFEPVYPGMGMPAEVINSMINKHFIARAPRAVNLFILVILSLLVSLAVFNAKPARGLFLLALGIIFFVILALFLFNYFGIWIDMICPILVIVLLYLFLMMHKYVIEWKNRIFLEKELDIAKTIQESFLPKKMPDVEGIDMSALMLTAHRIGGDVYAFVDSKDGKIGVMIGDVSGKGVPASLFMAMVAGAFKLFSKLKSRPRDVLSSLNSELVTESSSNLFVTMFYAIFNVRDGSVVYSNGGHLPLLYVNRFGKVIFLDSGDGLPLGLIEGEYSEKNMKFEKGDIFVFYTDGITEAMNSKSELYGEERLERIVKSKINLPSHEILKAIEKDVRQFEPKAKQHDDITLIVIKA